MITYFCAELFFMSCCRQSKNKFSENGGGGHQPSNSRKIPITLLEFHGTIQVFDFEWKTLCVKHIISRVLDNYTTTSTVTTTTSSTAAVTTTAAATSTATVTDYYSIV